jgi:nitric oxide reductase NorQ protein
VRGYQSVLKDLTTSTRQRTMAIELDFPPPELELEILRIEAPVDAEVASDR